MYERKLIHEIKKNATEKVKIEFGFFNEEEFVKIRVYKKVDKEDWIPTNQGICLQGKLIYDVTNVLDDIYGAKMLEIEMRNLD